MLRQLIDNKITAKEIRQQWPITEKTKDKDIVQAYHILFHFEDDEDIRTKDSRYANWQIKQIEQIIINLSSK